MDLWFYERNKMGFESSYMQRKTRNLLEYRFLGYFFLVILIYVTYNENEDLNNTSHLEFFEEDLELKTRNKKDLSYYSDLYFDLMKIGEIKGKEKDS